MIGQNMCFVSHSGIYNLKTNIEFENKSIQLETKDAIEGKKDWDLANTLKTT